jgi:hypothetical protein
MAMANFLLVYTGSGGAPPTEEERAAILQDWTSWFTTLGENLVDAGNPTAPTAKRIASDGAVSDGAVGEPVMGYSIIKADSLDAATEAAKGCPQLKAGGQVTVYETYSAM